MHAAAAMCPRGHISRRRCAPLLVQLDMLMDGDYCRVITPETPMNDEVEEVCSMINEMMKMRAKWLFKVCRRVDGGSFHTQAPTGMNG